MSDAKADLIELQKLLAKMSARIAALEKRLDAIDRRHNGEDTSAAEASEYEGIS